MLWPPFSTNQSHFSPASWRTLSRRRTRVASALCGLRFQPTGRHFSPAHWQALSCRRTRVALAPRGLRSSTQTSRTPLLASSTIYWRTLSCRQHHVGTHNHASQVSNQTDATARQYASSPALSRVDVHCFSHCTLGTPHCAGCHHAHIKVVSTGIKPYANAPASLIHSYAMGTFSFCVG